MHHGNNINTNDVKYLMNLLCNSCEDTSGGTQLDKSKVRKYRKTYFVGTY